MSCPRSLALCILLLSASPTACSGKVDSPETEPDSAADTGGSNDLEFPDTGDTGAGDAAADTPSDGPEPDERDEPEPTDVGSETDEVADIGEDSAGDSGADVSEHTDADAADLILDAVETGDPGDLIPDATDTGDLGDLIPDADESDGELADIIPEVSEDSGTGDVSSLECEPRLRAGDVSDELRHPVEFTDLDPTNSIDGSSVFAFGPDGTAYLGTEAGLFKSDLAEPFEWVNALAADADEVIGRVDAIYVTDSEIYVGADTHGEEEVYVLELNGQVRHNQLLNQGILIFVPDPENAGVILAGGRTGGIFRTTDGESWEMVANSGGAHIADLEFDNDGERAMATTGATNFYMDSQDADDAIRGESFTIRRPVEPHGFWPAGFANWPHDSFEVLMVISVSSNTYGGLVSCESFSCLGPEAVSSGDLIAGPIPFHPGGGAGAAHLIVDERITVVGTRNELWFSTDEAATFRFVSNLFCPHNGLNGVELNGDHLYLATDSGPFRIELSAFGLED